MNDATKGGTRNKRKLKEALGATDALETELNGFSIPGVATLCKIKRNLG